MFAWEYMHGINEWSKNQKHSRKRKHLSNLTLELCTIYFDVPHTVENAYEAKTNAQKRSIFSVRPNERHRCPFGRGISLAYPSVYYSRPIPVQTFSSSL